MTQAVLSFKLRCAFSLDFRGYYLPRGRPRARPQARLQVPTQTHASILSMHERTQSWQPTTRPTKTLAAACVLIYSRLLNSRAFPSDNAAWQRACPAH
eukprot:353784-Chlamydomonas_euryale.AAC.1